LHRSEAEDVSERTSRALDRPLQQAHRTRPFSLGKEIEEDTHRGVVDRVVLQLRSRERAHASNEVESNAHAAKTDQVDERRERDRQRDADPFEEIRRDDELRRQHDDPDPESDVRVQRDQGRLPRRRLIGDELELDVEHRTDQATGRRADEEQAEESALRPERAERRRRLDTARAAVQRLRDTRNAAVEALRPYALHRDREQSAQRECGHADREQGLGPESRADRARSEAPDDGAECVTGHHRREQALRLAAVEQIAHREPEREQRNRLELLGGEDQQKERADRVDADEIPERQ